MADSTRPNIKKINSLLSNVNSQMDKLYNSTYYSDNTNQKDLNRLSNSIEDDINSIISRNKDMDISGVSRLFSRMKLRNAVADPNLNNAVKELFEDNPLTNELLLNYVGNTWIKDLDNEIDTVIKYCTKIGDALDLMRDAVLSSDSYSKDFITMTIDTSNESEISVFEQRSLAILKKYNVQEKTKSWYDETSHHGEQFVYIVPYNKAIAKLLNNKKNVRPGIINFNITESAIPGTKNTSYNINQISRFSENDHGLVVEFDMSNMLSSCIEKTETSNRIISEGTKSLYENFISESSVLKNSSGYKKNSLDETIPNDLELPKDIESSASDGFIDKTKRDIVASKDLKVKGCVVKALKRECIIPLYVDDDICLGYYYFEYDQALGFDFYSTLADRYGNGQVSVGNQPISRITQDATNDQRIDELVRSISSTLSTEIDKRFINANQDLTKEIYAILKHNDIFNSNSHLQHLKISFLPEEDVHRLVFKIDPDTHRGISDVLPGLIPAKLFSCLYITNVTGILTRGQDRRVYYVKQTVETNISQTLLNVIEQIKKSNFGIRQINNLNNVLNIVGRFNDFVIPVGQSGDSPIQFEIMPGQEFNINDDLYNMLEEMAVNPIVPLELVQSRNSPDFATQFTSSSIKVLRSVFPRQSVMEEFLGGILTKIYNCEYGTNVRIRVELPPPMILNITNTSQMIQSTKDYVTQIADYEYEGDTSPTVEQEKSIFIRKMMRTLLASYVRSSTVDRYKEQAKMEINRLKEDEES